MDALLDDDANRPVQLGRPLAEVLREMNVYLVRYAGGWMRPPVQRIFVRGAPPAPRGRFFRTHGRDETFQIRQLPFQDVRVGGSLIRQPADLHLCTNEFANGIKTLP